MPDIILRAKPRQITSSETQEFIIAVNAELPVVGFRRQEIPYEILIINLAEVLPEIIGKLPEAGIEFFQLPEVYH
jgi:hypothetical protein